MVPLSDNKRSVEVVDTFKVFIKMLKLPYGGEALVVKRCV